MFAAYVEARENYLKEDARLGIKYQKIHSSKIFDRKKEDQLAVESAEVFDRATEINKKIFGQYYSAVKKIHKEYEDSIQVYSRDIPISLDFGFGE
jgi:NACalpha-BTF3-like transcription factor